jgi:hypothetical protein
MQSFLSKALATTLFAGTLAISGSVSANETSGAPLNILCQNLQNGVNALLDVGSDATLAQATGLVNKMIGMGCSADMIPALPAVL